MNFSPSLEAPGERAWSVGALCRAVADALEARFNPVRVRGEISGFSRAASGHCYFSLKDDTGQIRCAMFRRAASLLDFSPRDGEAVEVQGRLGVYEARGDLQLVVESMQRAGRGALFEQFLQRKARLEAEGLFDTVRKRPVPAMPRGIGVITSPDAAAWHDVMTALRRRVPHVPVLLAPALVQGAAAPASLMQAAQALFERATDARREPPLDVLLVVRGGGSMEDLWAFNDEALVRLLATSPVPVISGVGHETDFTLTDFVADLRAPTPTAAAELAATSREALLQDLQNLARHIDRAVGRQLDRHAQTLDLLASRLGRPQAGLARQRQTLQGLEHRLDSALASTCLHARHQLQRLEDRARFGQVRLLSARQQKLEQLAAGLQALDPHRVLERGYAWLMDEEGHAITRAAQLHPGQSLAATLADGQVPLQVLPHGH
ncbi:MAG: exodeoxyribonuclease VII large subunit [Limnohabitans sp.]